MTSPNLQIVENFTGTDGSAWANFATPYTATGALSSASETIVSNKGRAAGTTSTAPSIRRHRTLGFQNWPRSQPFEMTARFVRNTLNVKPALVGLYSTSSDASANMIIAQAETFTGKSTTYGLSIKSLISGTYTSLLTITSVAGADTISNTMGIGLRTWPLANGNLLIQAKLWNTSGAEPAWIWPTSDSSGNGSTNSNCAAYVLTAASVSSLPALGYYGFYEEMTAAGSYTVDWDFVASYTRDPSAIISSNFGTLSATGSATPTTPSGIRLTTVGGTLSYVGGSMTVL